MQIARTVQEIWGFKCPNPIVDDKAQPPVLFRNAKHRRVPVDLAIFLIVQNGLTWGPMPGGVVKTCSYRILSDTVDM